MNEESHEEKLMNLVIEQLGSLQDRAKWAAFAFSREALESDHDRFSLSAAHVATMESILLGIKSAISELADDHRAEYERKNDTRGAQDDIGF